VTHGEQPFNPGSWREDEQQSAPASGEPPERDSFWTMFGVVPPDCRTTGRPEIDTVEYERAHYAARLGGGLSHGVGGQRLYTPTPSRWQFMKVRIGGGS
jgi:hypothetical protein